MVVKPACLPVHTVGQYRKNTVLGVLQAERPDLGMLLCTHRLDKPVSGLMLLARNPAAANRMRKQLEVGRGGGGGGNSWRWTGGGGGIQLEVVGGERAETAGGGLMLAMGAGGSATLNPRIRRGSSCSRVGEDLGARGAATATLCYCHTMLEACF